MKFKTTDFVQVEHTKILESGEPATYWRNALYVKCQDGYHTVIYADSTLHVVMSCAKIRKVR